MEYNENISKHPPAVPNWKSGSIMEYNEKRRESPRAPVTVAVKYKGVKDFLVEYSRNISKGGIFLNTSNLLPYGTEVRLLFTLPGSTKEIKILGKVVHTITREEGRQRNQETGMGIEFIDFSPSSKIEISEYIEGLLAEKDVAIEQRRKHPRFESRIKIGFKSVRDFLWEYSEDISKGGLFVKTNNPMPLKSRLQLKLCLPGRHREISVTGEVVYIVKAGDARKAPGMGIQLVDLDKNARSEIDEYLEELRVKSD
ncbi:MAG: TIGR02266 family protein [Deltaproteobacteria bacterium]|nr:MAG: TIGR02266 family protein [Deltaproteobacteria bacterium]